MDIHCTHYILSIYTSEPQRLGLLGKGFRLSLIKSFQFTWDYCGKQDFTNLHSIFKHGTQSIKLTRSTLSNLVVNIAISTNASILLVPLPTLTPKLHGSQYLFIDLHPCSRLIPILPPPMFEFNQAMPSPSNQCIPPSTCSIDFHHVTLRFGPAHVLS